MPPPGLLKRPSFMKTIDMKRIVILFLLLLPAVSFAQDFQVYSVKGAVTVKNGASPESVTPGMTLKANSLLDIPADARIVVLLESKKELHTLKGPAVDQVGNLVKKEGHSTQQLTESYLAFIKQKMTDSGSQKDRNYKQSAGTSYRETDSLLMQVLVPIQESVDSTKK